MSPCSYCSRFSRFMFLNRSVRCNPGDRALVSGTKGRGFESRQARFPPLWNFEESPLSHPPLKVSQNLRKFVWSISPCSYPSRCSRFRILKRSVRCISDGKITAKHAKTAKVLMIYFSVFVPFAFFAVHRIQRECPL